jgi:hypothetical protein
VKKDRVADMLGHLRAALSQLVDKECWSVVAGRGTGSTIHMALGRRVPRRAPLLNETLSALERTHEGEFDLFIESAWRLERGAEVLCGSTDDDDNDGAMVAGLGQLVGKRVLSVVVCTPVPDFAMRLEDELCLNVFCDQTNLKTTSDNYSVRFGDTIVAVTVRGRIVEEIRRSN